MAGFRRTRVREHQRSNAPHGVREHERQLATDPRELHARPGALRCDHCGLAKPDVSPREDVGLTLCQHCHRDHPDVVGEHIEVTEELPSRPEGDYENAADAARRAWEAPDPFVAPDGGIQAERAFEAAADELKRLAPHEPVTAGQVRYAMRQGIGPAVDPHNAHGRDFIMDDEVVR